MSLGAPYPGGGAWGLPDDVEDGGQDELVVYGAGHVARLVEGGRDGAHGQAQVHRPQQEQELRWRHTRNRRSVMCVLTTCIFFFAHFYTHIYMHVAPFHFFITYRINFALQNTSRAVLF